LSSLQVSRLHASLPHSPIRPMKPRDLPLILLHHHSLPHPPTPHPPLPPTPPPPPTQLQNTSIIQPPPSPPTPKHHHSLPHRPTPHPRLPHTLPLSLIQIKNSSIIQPPAWRLIPKRLRIPHQLQLLLPQILRPMHQRRQMFLPHNPKHPFHCLQLP